MIHKLSKVVEMHELRIQIGLTSSAFDRVKQNLFVLKEELGVPTEDGHIHIPYPITLKELAVNSGTTRETAGQVIKQLRIQDYWIMRRNDLLFAKRRSHRH